MALVQLDRASNLTATTGTGAITLGAAVQGCQTVAGIGVGNTAYYTILDGTLWENGIGTLTSTTVFTRTKVLSSSSSGAAINLDGSGVLSLGPIAQAQNDTVNAVSYQLGRNRLRNSRFVIAQRGASFTTSGAYGPDGWIGVLSGGTYAGSVGGMSSTYGYSGSFTLKATTLPAAGTLTAIQRIESYDIADLVGQQMTVSFWLLGSTSAGTISFSASLLTPATADTWGSGTLTTQQTISIPITATATRVSVTFNALPAAAALGLALYLQLTQNTSTGTATFTIAGVQLEPGSYATPLEKRPAMWEFLLCERYYQTAQLLAGGYGLANTPIYVTYGINPMRGTPTIALSSTSDANLGTPTLNYVTNAIYATATVTATGNYSLNIVITASSEL